MTHAGAVRELFAIKQLYYDQAVVTLWPYCGHPMTKQRSSYDHSAVINSESVILLPKNISLPHFCFE